MGESLNIWNTEKDMTHIDVLAEEMANIFFTEYMTYLSMIN
jgi:hypothetical protein